MFEVLLVFNVASLVLLGGIVLGVAGRPGVLFPLYFAFAAVAVEALTSLQCGGPNEWRALFWVSLLLPAAVAPALTRRFGRHREESPSP